jgi:hypothetical protein
VERRDVEVGVDERERVGALLEVVEQLGEPVVRSSRNFGPMRHVDDV